MSLIDGRYDRWSKGSNRGQFVCYMNIGAKILSRKQPTFVNGTGSVSYVGYVGGQGLSSEWHGFRGCCLVWSAGLKILKGEKPAR